MKKIELSIMKNADDFEFAQNTINYYLQSTDISGECLFQLRLCVAEVLNNILIHSPPSKSVLDVIEISCALLGNTYAIRISHRAPAFSVNAELPGAESESGRGWYIIKKCLDDFAYYHHQGTNIISLYKTKVAEAVI